MIILHIFATMAIDARIRSNISTVFITLLLSLAYLINVDLVEIPHIDIFGINAMLKSSSQGVGSYSAPLQPLVAWQYNNPVWAHLISALLIVGGAIYTMRLTIKFNLFGSVIHIPSIIYLAMMVSLVTPSQIIIAPATSVLMLLSLRKIYDSYTSQLSSPKIFSGCFWIGVIPLIYPSTLPLALSFLPVMIVLERGGRELLLALWAIVTPTTIGLYVAWLFGYDIGVLWSDYCDSLSVVGYNFAGELWGLLTIFVCGILSVVAAMRIDTISLTITARQRIIYTMTLIFLALLSITLPSFAPPLFCIVAAPVAVLLTTLFLELNSRWATIIYLVFILLAVLSSII